MDNSLLTAYNPQDKNEAVGVRFEYAPVAGVMTEVFERRWQEAEEVD